MKLSIIVPVYNAEKYLRECLTSLVSQDMSDYELILVDDGSTDSSRQIIGEFARKYPGLISVKTVANGGQGRARNIGIQLARGEYIGFADSDDWVKRNMFSTLVAAANAEGADMAVCDWLEYYDDGRVLINHGSNFDRRGKISTAVWNKVFRRECVKGLRFPEGLWYEDLEFVVMAAARSRIIKRVHEPLYCYRIGQSSTMNNNNARKNLDIITVMEDIRTFLGKENKDWFECLLLNHILLDSIKRLSVQDNGEKKEIIAELRAYVKKYIPDLSRCDSYRMETKNRQAVMALNYRGMEDVAKNLLKLKALRFLSS